MDLPERHRWVLDQLRTRGHVDVTDLSEQTGASVITIRRDLEQLAAVGALRRVRGGALPSMLRGEGMPFALRSSADADLKRRMGIAAAELIADGEAVAVDSGSTGEATARALADRRVTAIPLSIQSLDALRGRARIVVPGGELDEDEGTFVGPLVERSLDALRLDSMILTCCGVSIEAGVMAYTLRDAAAKQAAQRIAARTVLVAESAKFSITAMARVCRLDEVTAIVSDTDLPDPVGAWCADAGIDLVLVDADSGRTRAHGGAEPDPSERTGSPL